MGPIAIIGALPISVLGKEWRTSVSVFSIFVLVVDFLPCWVKLSWIIEMKKGSVANLQPASSIEFSCGWMAGLPIRTIRWGGCVS